MSNSQSLPFTWDEWVELDATELAAHVARGDATPVELAQQARAANEIVGPTLNAVLEIFDDAVDDPYRDGMSNSGPYHGVPMLLKDIASGMKGRLQEKGALFLKGNLRDEDDPLTLNWRNGGLNLIGRTATPMFGMAGVTDSLINGITRNPWNTEFTPSGSSGGSAAAVAAGIVPIASASDGGGSTRSPAGYTGLIGLKPTRGRLPKPDGTNEFASHIGVEGVLTRTVRDTAIAYDSMTRLLPGQSFMQIESPKRSYLDDCRTVPNQLRIALLTGDCNRDGTADPEVIETIDRMAKRLENLGHIIEPIDDDSLCDWNALFRSVDISFNAGAQFWPEAIRATGREITEQTIEPVFWHLIDAARRFELRDFLSCRAENAKFTRQFGNCFEEYDLILSPVEAVTAPRCGPESPSSPLFPASSADDADQFIKLMTDNGRFMVAANEAGFPAISVPAGIDKNGVPIGAQLAAAWCREDLLIQVAAQLESAHPELFNQRPPISVTMQP